MRGANVRAVFPEQKVDAMRNHLISVAIGFVLGGLVLVPLALHWQDAPPVQVADGQAETIAPTGTIDFEDLDLEVPRRLPIVRSVPDTDAVDSQRRSTSSAGFVPSLHWPGHEPNVVDSGDATGAWRGSSTSPIGRGLDGMLALASWNETSRARSRELIYGAGAAPERYPLIPTAFELREDTRARHGLVASTLLAVLPRTDASVVTEFTMTSRLDDEPVVSLPATSAPISVRQLTNLDTPQRASESITVTPVQVITRTPSTASSGSAGTVIDAVTTTPYGPELAYGPEVPVAIVTPTLTGSSNVTPPVTTGNPTTPTTTPETPATPTVPTTPLVPTSPTSPLSPTIPEPTPIVPAPTVPTPTAPSPTAPTPTAPSPTIPLPAPNFPSGPAGVRSNDLIALPEGTEITFLDPFYGGSGQAGVVGGVPTTAGISDPLFGDFAGLGGAVLNVVPEPVTGLLFIAGLFAIGSTRRQR
ncbi:MAG: PEP-CTERM sorting domain-containing protein [Phycisphaerales bacterium]|nr:PEP-CTERM sorting domain-containing protein [Phycisphaerales bacterium]